MISIIIPVYQTEPAIFEECLRSIAGQTFEDFEVLIISDGAPDPVLQPAREISRTDQRFQIHIQENQGVSTARNNGLNLAEGSKICFIDSDDRIDPDYLEQLNAALQDLDIVCTGHTKLVQDRKIPHPIHKAAHVMNTDTIGTVWGKLYQKKWIGSRRFNPALSRAEDMEFNIRVFQNARVGIMENCGYQYRYVSGSAVHAYDEKTIQKYMDTLKAIESQKLDPDQQRVYCSAAATIFRVIVENYIMKLPVSRSEKKKRVLELLKQEPFPEVFRRIDYSDFSLSRRLPLIFAGKGMPGLLMAVIRIKQRMRGEEK